MSFAIDSAGLCHVPVFGTETLKPRHDKNPSESQGGDEAVIGLAQLQEGGGVKMVVRNPNSDAQKPT